MIRSPISGKTGKLNHSLGKKEGDLVLAGKVAPFERFGETKLLGTGRTKQMGHFFGKKVSESSLGRLVAPF